MSDKTCERCGSSLKFRRVTCCNCGRGIGRFYDCGCAELWTERGPPRFFCRNGERGTPSDCNREYALMARRYAEGELRPSFVKKMVRLNGRWP